MRTSQPSATASITTRSAVLTSEFGVPRRLRWYHNLMAHPVASVELGAETCSGGARVAHPTERRQWCDRIDCVIPQVAAVVEHAHCEIPVVVLDPIDRPA